ncbi:MAG TPA: hypothetical protein VK821_06615 [Dehalococcoidia bacterium]|nr:hypothetical protein [Dehalococcoidia bacterium]
MKLYFDSNIYDFITEHDEAKEMRRTLDLGSHKVIASNANLFEAWAIPRYEERAHRVRTIAIVASQLERLPESYIQAQELLAQIRGHSPVRLRTQPDRQGVRQARAFLRGHRLDWKELKDDSGYRPGNFGGYRMDASSATTKPQKRLRTLFRSVAPGGVKDGALEIRFPDEAIEKMATGMSVVERYCRHSSASVWYAAIVGRHRAMRDYADWTLPYLRPGVVTWSGLLEFWVRDVEWARVPVNMVTTMTEYYQTAYSVTHGNLQDALHAAQLLSSDAFVTADRDFYRVLCDVAPHFPKAGTPVFVRKASPSALVEIPRALAEARASTSP